MSMTLIEHIEVGSGGAASIAFTSIGGDFTDLLLVASLRDTTGISSFQLQKTVLAFNGDTSNDTVRGMEGRLLGVLSGDSTDRVAYHAAPPAVSNAFSSTKIYISNYAGASAKYFSVDYIVPSNSSSGDNTYMGILAGEWTGTAAITSLTLSTPGSFVQYSSATLYGITAGSDGTTTVS